MQAHFIELKRTYIKLKSNVCFPVQCHADCLSCSGTPDRCESCRDPKALLHLGRCLSVCPAGYYAEGRVCAGMTLFWYASGWLLSSVLSRAIISHLHHRQLLLQIIWQDTSDGILTRKKRGSWVDYIRHTDYTSSAEAPCGPYTTIRLGVSHLSATYSGSVLSVEYQVPSTFWI